MFAVVFVTEYLRRVRSKTFLAVTLLVPLALFSGIGAITLLVDLPASQSAAERRAIVVFEEDGRVLDALRAAESEAYRLSAAAETLEAAKRALLDGRYDALLVLPSRIAAGASEQALRLYVAESHWATAQWQRRLRHDVLNAVRDVQLARYQLPAELLAILQDRPDFEVVSLSAEGEQESGSSVLSATVGVAIAFVVLMLAAGYGGIVMQVVMEEKTSRMAEIVLSSVAPFQLMMGKVLSVAAVAATQMVAWGALLLAGAVIWGQMGIVDPNLMEGLPSVAAADADSAAGVLNGLRYDVMLVVICLLPLGYLINASVFAALGAMHENPMEAQMSVMLAMAPSVVALVMAQTMFSTPDSGLVTFGAFFPFTAPAILPAYMLMTDVPVWQTLLSMALCGAATIGMIWLAARIFRGSMLIYGKKPTLRDLRRVIFAD